MCMKASRKIPAIESEGFTWLGGLLLLKDFAVGTLSAVMPNFWKPASSRPFETVFEHDQTWLEAEFISSCLRDM